MLSCDQGGQLTFGGVDADFTGIGGSVCLLVILLMFTLSTLIGHLVPNLLEVCSSYIKIHSYPLSLGDDDPCWRSADDHCWGTGCQLPLDPLQPEELLQGLGGNVTCPSLKWVKYCLYLAQAGIALGVIAIIAGIVFIVDFIFAVRKLKVSIG